LTAPVFLEVCPGDKSVRKINTKEIAEFSWSSPEGIRGRTGKNSQKLSEALDYYDGEE